MGSITLHVIAGSSDGVDFLIFIAVGEVKLDRRSLQSDVFCSGFDRLSGIGCTSTCRYRT